MSQRHSKTLLFSAVCAALYGQLTLAQEEQQQANNDALGFEQILVTGSARGGTVMESSESVSLLSDEQLELMTPRSTAEIFRTIPGIRSESTGGEGNANIAVRGLPVASGGAKFLLLQEDGLPVLQFGDIAFGNADIFLRADSTVKRIEAIRGGSSSTSASNSPGGIINFISKTGEQEGGSVSATFGLDYDSFRTDFEYGGEINENTRFHIGGFLRQGEGPRDPGYKGNKGGQIKANITREFDTGYVRVYFKHLDDRVTSYMPMPMRADGGSLPGYDALQDTLQSSHLLSLTRLDGENNVSTVDMRDGMHPVVNSFGLEASFDLSDDWSIEERFRFSDVSGNFVTLFPAEVGSASDIAQSIGGQGATLTYATGGNRGQAFDDPLAVRIHSFDVEINDFGSYVNDLKLSRDFEQSTLTIGYYKASQNIDMSWLWNSYLMELKGNNAALLNVLDADGQSYSDNGLYAYGVPFWGNCCQRNYNTEYNIDAPYLTFNTELDNWSLEASVRHDSGDATGVYAGAIQVERDINGDGTLSVPEQSVSAIDITRPSLVDYDWSYTSYSFGANYQFSNDLALFARLSHGGRANADRLLFGKVNADGSVSKQDAVDEVDQFELGTRYRVGSFSLFATAFYAETEEQNFEATSQRFFDRVYEAKGIELESAYFVGDFDFRGSLTWTDAEISEDALNPGVIGNTPRRQADVIYSLSARYNFDLGSVGTSIIGSSETYAQDNNDLEFDAYTQVNVFASYILADDLTLSLNINNLFDEVGITEAEEASVPANGIIRARSINGRTSSVTLEYSF